MPTETEIKERLKKEIDGMSMKQLQNATKSNQSKESWIKRTVKRIWGIVIDHIVGKLIDILFGWSG